MFVSYATIAAKDRECRCAKAQAHFNLRVRLHADVGQGKGGVRKQINKIKILRVHFSHFGEK